MNKDKNEEQINFYMANMQKVLFVARELHNKGYEKLRVIPSLSPSGASWRCSFVTERDRGIIASSWIYQIFENDFTTTEINLSIIELTERFETEHSSFLRGCLGRDYEYKEWYSGMLRLLRTEELPYAFCDYFSPTDYWKTSKDNKITTLPNEIRFYYDY